MVRNVYEHMSEVAASNLNCGTIEIGDAEKIAHQKIFQDIVAALDAGEIRKAENLLYKAFQQDPDNPGYHAFQAICLAVAGKDPEAALSFAKQLVTENPLDSCSHYALGRVLLLAGNRLGAFRKFDDARRLSRSDPFMICELAKVDKRRPPVIESLARDHFLNILLGRIRSLLGR